MINEECVEENSMKLFVLIFKSESVSAENEQVMCMSRTGDQRVACVFDNDIENARKKLERFIEKQGGTIQPISIDEGELESLLWGLRLAKRSFIEMLLMEEQNTITKEDLKLMKKPLYEGIERKRKQIRRAQKLIERIERLEETDNNDLTPELIEEIMRLGIVWKPYPVVRQ